MTWLDILDLEVEVAISTLQCYDVGLSGWMNVGMDWEKQELHNVTFVFASQWLQIRSATPFGVGIMYEHNPLHFSSSQPHCNRAVEMIQK